MADGMNQVQGARGKHPEGHKRQGLAAVLLACALPAAGADLGDPTRPPPGFGESATAQEARQEAPLLVSGVFLMGSKPYAVLDGQVVRVGDKLAGGRVHKIDETGVWLAVPAGGSVPAGEKTLTGMRQLKLLPDVKKTPAGRGKEKVEKG